MDQLSQTAETLSPGHRSSARADVLEVLIGHEYIVGRAHDDVEEHQELGDLHPSGVGDKDDILVAHLDVGGEEITAGLAEAHIEVHRNELAGGVANVGAATQDDVTW